MRFKRLLVTGGAGFIGSAFIRYGLQRMQGLEKVVNLDLLTYAGNLENLRSVQEDTRYLFVQGDIRDEALVQGLLAEHEIDALVHFAAETHVDRSIQDPQAFIDTNVYGTLALLNCVRCLPHVHFHHVSTDEVYGSLEAGFFTEESPYRPNSPYAASKAASDHLVRAWKETYQLSTTLSHCTNNYGPYQHGEKFIPRMISRGLQGATFPLYGTGKNVRDWLYVDDHVEALFAILERGKRGEVYDIGGGCEKANLELLHDILRELELSPSRIEFVPDRAGHDFRYAIDCSKIKRELDWSPKHSFAQGLQETINWYQGVLCG